MVCQAYEIISKFHITWVFKFLRAISAGSTGRSNQNVKMGALCANLQENAQDAPFSLSQFLFFITSFQIGNYNWSIFNRAHCYLNLTSAPFRLMSKHKINFFQSPNPIHSHFQNIRYEYHQSQDNEANQDLLFSTPARNNPIVVSPNLFVGSEVVYRRQPSDNISEQNPNEQMDQQGMSSAEIKDKLQFSQHEPDDMLLPITPLKIQKKRQEQYENQETVRRYPQFTPTAYQNTTPISQNRSNERGLKRLAAQSYRFVMQQKRANYKQVANKLIEQLGQDSLLIEGNRRGEMNIKRRVYDALNVLIALGLLRRNGNKIMCKREDMQFSGEDSSIVKQRQRRRQMAMEQELYILKQAYQRKQAIVQQKRKLQLELRGKLQSLKEIIEKNKAKKDQMTEQDSKLHFPFIAMCINKPYEQTYFKREQPQSKYTTRIQQQKQQAKLKLWQNTPQQLLCSFKKNQHVSILGEFDVMGLYKSKESRERSLKVQKNKRRR